MSIIIEKYEKRVSSKREVWFSLVECEHPLHVGERKRIIRKDNALKCGGIKYCGSCSRGGEKHPCFGKHLSKEMREKLSLANSGEKNCHYGKRGKETSRWRDDLTQEERELNKDRSYNPKNREWREMVFKRDNWRCLFSGRKGVKLEAHHLYNWADYPEKRFDIKNGITLCKEIHKLFHKRYRYRNNTPEQFEEFKLWYTYDYQI